jgi:hypothetical protein
LDFSAYPELANLAVSDDATTLLASFGTSGEETLIEFSADTPGIFVLRTAKTEGMSFRANSSDAVILDAGDNLYLVHGSDSGIEATVVANAAKGLSGASQMALTGDGNTAVVLNGDSSTIVAIDLVGSGVQMIDCQCKPTQLRALKNNSFLLTAPSAQPAWLLDMASGEPRALFVPQPLSAPHCRFDLNCFMKGPYAPPRIVPVPTP